MRKVLVPALLTGLALAACGDDTSGTGGGGEGGEGASSTTTTTTTTTSSGGGEGGGTEAVCGDGDVGMGEACDDGNTTAGDGCSASCAIESGYECAGEPSVCATDCGDGVIAGAEACDDGNQVADDGCSLTCTVETGFDCTGTPSVCTSTCGDSVIAADEGCDDGNTTAGDGCSTTCDIDAGWACTGTPSVCTTSCGDGVPAGAEACDDGNMVDGDGCSMACAVETGFACTGTPSVCAAVCGDGVLAGTEECDDGNTDGGDCCSAMCEIEAGCEVEPNNTIATANDFMALQVNGFVNGFVDPAGDVNYYSITLTEPGNLTVETFGGVLGTPCATSGTPDDVDTRVRVFDGVSPTALGSNDDKAANWCSRLVLNNLAAGTYYVAVDASTFADPAATFDYSLQLSIKYFACGDGVIDPGEQCDDGNMMPGDGCNATCQAECPGSSEVEPNDTFATANGPLVNNVQSCAAINPAGDDDFWSFTVAALSDVSLETFDGNGNQACTSTHDTQIFLLDTNGTTQLATNDDISSSPVDRCSRIVRTRMAPGTYFLRVIRFGDATVIPSYRVRMRLDAVCGNSVVEGSEQCDGGANCNPDCTRIPTCGDGFVDAPETCDDGNLINGDGCSSTCQAEGVTNEVEPNNSTAEADANAVQINSDALIAGSIATAGDLDFFRLTLAVPQVVRFETFDASGNNCASINTTLSVLNSGGTAVSSDSTINNAGIGNCSAYVASLPAGTYYARVGASSGTIAAYRLQIKFQSSQGSETEPNDTLATANGNVSGGVDVFVFGDHQVGADQDWYAITVPAGASIRAEVIEGSTAETCEGLGIDSRLTLYNAGGTQLVDDDDDGRGFCSAIDGTGTGVAAADSGARNLAAGTYYLQVRASGSASATGAQFDYRLVVTVRTP